MPKCEVCGLDIEGANQNLQEAVELTRVRALEDAARYLEGRGLVIEAEAVRLLAASES
jgi:hypothetical protein